MKILYVTTVGITMGFFVDEFKKLISDGHTVELACNKSWDYKKEVSDLNLKRYNIPFSRSPLSIDNIEAYKILKKLIVKNHYDIVHCHTPNAAAITRLACKNIRKSKVKVIYTAHGFHFYKGAPLKNWLIYYPVEWLCSHWTDVLITINSEDYVLAQKRMKAKKIEYVPGVGIDLSRFGVHHTDSASKRKELGIPRDKLWLLNVGELIKRKNQEMLIRALQNFPDMYLTIAGKGELEEQLKGIIVELKLESRVRLLGYRTDISELCEACDIFVFPSYQEGLSVALMEAMACGKPIVCSSIRGNIDLVDSNGGELFDSYSIDELKAALGKIKKRNLIEMGRYNAKKIKNFDLDTVLKEMKEISELQSIGEYNHFVDLTKRYHIRKSLNIGSDDIVLLSVGELNENKNHEIIIRAIKGMDVYYLIAGQGDKKNRLIEIAKEVGMGDRVVLLGYREDVRQLLYGADVFMFPSRREGLGLAALEAMACGLPLVTSNIHGINDYSIDGVTGYKSNPDDVAGFRNAIMKILKSDRQAMSEYNKKKVEDYKIEMVLERMNEIYGEYS